ncbi:polysaccharide deacetylase family protein [Streptomyces sp. NPDC054842]
MTPRPARTVARRAVPLILATAAVLSPALILPRPDTAAAAAVSPARVNGPAPAKAHVAAWTGPATDSRSPGLPAPASQPAPPPGPSARPPLPKEFLGAEVRRIPTTRRVVALTFNAGWDDTGVDTALAELRRRGVPATFFLTGRFAERHPGAARAIAAEHGVGNHSYSHPRFDGLTSRRVTEEVLRADRAIRRASGAVPLPFFRFPYGATTSRGISDVNALGYADIEFTVDTNGYLGAARGMTVQKVVDRVLDALSPGEIVQLHVGTPDGRTAPLDVQALPRIIDAVRARGYRFTDLGRPVHA